MAEPDRRAPSPVGYFGGAGTFSHHVAVRRFGEGADCRPYPFMTDLVRDLGDGTVQAAVIPIENSVGGWVVDILDLILGEDFRGAGIEVTEEILIPIVLSWVGHAAPGEAEAQRRFRSDQHYSCTPGARRR